MKIFKVKFFYYEMFRNKMEDHLGLQDQDLCHFCESPASKTIYCCGYCDSGCDSCYKLQFEGRTPMIDSEIHTLCGTTETCNHNIGDRT